MLGVVLGQNLSAEEFVKFAAFVTQWGRDPRWQTDETTNAPAPVDFDNTVFQKNEVPEEKEAPPLVSIVPFPVDFDKDGRCFCDINLIYSSRTDRPFVRLALARFQPDSIKGLKMSRIVLADFAQLAPIVTVTVTSSSADVFGVTVNGLTHDLPTSPCVIAPPNVRGTRMRVSVQERIPGTADEAGWLPAGGNVYGCNGKRQAHRRPTLEKGQ